MITYLLRNEFKLVNIIITIYFIYVILSQCIDLKKVYRIIISICIFQHNLLNYITY